MALEVKSGASVDLWTVDPTSKAGRVTLYDSSGNVIATTDGGTLTATSGGEIQAGKDYKIARALRATPDGALQTAAETLILYDTIEGAAYDSNKWIQTLTTMTVTQATGVLTFNASAITTTTTGAMHLSHRFIPFLARAPITFRTRMRMSATAANTIIEVGFASPTSATSAGLANGAVWRKDSSGQWIPTVSIGGTEIQGTPVSDATFRASVGTNDYSIFWIMVEDTHATFQIWTQAGVLVNRQAVDWGTGTAASGFTQTHLQAMHRVYNSGVAGAAVQLFVSGTVIYIIDAAPNKPWNHQLAGLSYSPITSPTAYTQLANWTNNAAPTTRTLANTTAAEATLGGLLSANSIAGGNNDLIMFGFQVPSPYQFHFTGIRITPPLNQVAAVATTATIFLYGMAFNSSAVSLATAAPYTPMRIGLGGVHTGAIALAANALFSGNDIIWQPQTPVVVFPGRFLHVFCREIVGTATATETYLWNVQIDGYFE